MPTPTTTTKQEVVLNINIGTQRPCGTSEEYGLVPSATFEDDAIDLVRTLAHLRACTLPADCTIVSAHLKTPAIPKYAHECLVSPLAGKFNTALVGFTGTDKITYTSAGTALNFLASDMLHANDPDSAWIFRAQTKSGHKRKLAFNGIVDLFQTDMVALTPTDPEAWTTPVLTVLPGESPAASNGYVENWKRLMKFIKSYSRLYRLTVGTESDGVWEYVEIGDILYKFCGRKKAGSPFELVRGRA